MTGCPFYGYALYWRGNHVPVFTDSGGNQCALITAAHSPCAMDLAGAEPEWLVCRRNPANSDETFLVAIGTTSGPLAAMSAPCSDTPESVAEKVKAARDWGRRFEAMGRTEGER